MSSSRPHKRRMLSRMMAVAASAALLFSAGCAVSEKDKPAGESTGSTSADADKLTIFATTGYLGDAAKNIAPEADITVMVGPGGDPHTYQPSTKDIEKMRSADVVLWNGLHLEAQMIDQLESLGDKQLSVGKEIPKDMLLPWPEKDDEGNDLFDPHIWNSPDIWMNVSQQIVDKLSQTDSAHADQYKANGEKYINGIKDMKKKAEEALSKIPEAQRTLVTGHDAFQYFGKTFGLEVLATDFVTSESEMSAAELNDLAALIAEKKLPMIFQDNLKNPQAIKSLEEAVKSKGWEVSVSDEELFADSLGDHSPVDTYFGAYEHNVETIVKALTSK